MAIETKFQSLYEALHDLPQEILNMPGRFLYSSQDTMKRGKYYLLGFAPDVDPVNTHDLQLEIEKWEELETNAFTDEPWDGKEPGQHKIQKSVQALCDIVSVKVQDVCATNWFFPRSPSAAELKQKGFTSKKFVEKHKNVHEVILEIVQPEVIFAIGVNNSVPDISTYHVVKNAFGFEEADDFSSEHGNWRCKVALRPYKHKTQKLVGIPSFGRYTLYNKPNVLSYIAKQ